MFFCLFFIIQNKNVPSILLGSLTNTFVYEKSFSEIYETQKESSSAIYDRKKSLIFFVNNSINFLST